MKKKSAAGSSSPPAGEPAGYTNEDSPPERIYYISQKPIFPYMSTNEDITNENRSATKGADCRTESEKHPAHGRAHDYADLVHHHNERGKKERGSVPKTEPEPDYESEGMIPHN